MLGVGGPDVLTQKQAAELAFEVLGKTPTVTHLPIWLLRGATAAVRALSTQFGDLAEFIVTAGQVDGVAPAVGRMTLRTYFEGLAADPKHASGTPKAPRASNADAPRH